VRSATISLVGDSTGDGSDEWFSLLGARLQQFYPTYGLILRDWDDTAQSYSPPVVLANGPRGDRKATFAAGQLQYTGGTITGDLEVIVRANPTSWSSGSAQTLAAKYETTGNQRSWQLNLSSTGRIQFIWSADGISAVATVNSTVSVPFANGTAGWVKVAFDVDNGSAGNTATFSTSTDGVTFTTLGTPVITAGVTSIFGGTAPYSLGSYGTGVTTPLTGDILWCEIKSGLNGYSIVPPLPDDWEQSTTATSVTYGGSPQIVLMNGAVSGTATSYFDNATRRPKLSYPSGQDVLFVNTGHNESGGWSFVTGAFATAMTNLKTQVPGVPIVVIGQNPVIVGSTVTSQQDVDRRPARQAQLLTWAGSQAGVYPLDIYPTLANFFDGSQGLITADGLHPSRGPGSGSAAWADAVFAAIVGQ
jgi:hypothetical protein